MSTIAVQGAMPSRIMREPSADVNADGACCQVGAKLDSLIDLAVETPGPLGVVDEQGHLVGEIDQAMILKAMDSRS